MVPLPDSWSVWRPNYLGVLIVYWCLYTPRRVGVTTAWFCGLALDVMQFTLLGQQALSKTLIAFVANKFGSDVTRMTVLHQLGFVFILLVFDVVIISIIQAIFLQSSTNWKAVASALTAVLFWPLICQAFDARRRRHGIA